MKRFSTLAVAVAIAPLAFAQENSIEEIVITSSLVHASSTATAFTVSGEEIVQAGSQSLGEHLSDLPGVSSNNFGPAVGQPVIRGMSGNRVKLLQNGLVIRDASGIGPDHANDLDLNNVQQIEVVRGASALLYSNGASGGIINVVDNTIARSDVEEPTAYISGESQSVNDGQGFSAGARGNLAGFNLSYDYSEFDADSYDIPRGAILHDEEHEGEHEDHDEDMTTLANSDYETESQRIGISKTGDWGYVGASYQELSSSYGIPFHGEHAEHEGEDHDDDHEGEDHDEDHDEEGHGNEHEEHGEERIVSSTDSEILSPAGHGRGAGGGPRAPGDPLLCRAGPRREPRPDSRARGDVRPGSAAALPREARRGGRHRLAPGSRPGRPRGGACGGPPGRAGGPQSARCPGVRGRGARRPRADHSRAPGPGTRVRLP